MHYFIDRQTSALLLFQDNLLTQIAALQFFHTTLQVIVLCSSQQCKIPCWTLSVIPLLFPSQHIVALMMQPSLCFSFFQLVKHTWR